MRMAARMVVAGVCSGRPQAGGGHICPNAGATREGRPCIHDCGKRTVGICEERLMIDNEVLREKMQLKLDILGLTGDCADQLVRELNFLACLLIEAAGEGRLNG